MSENKQRQNFKYDEEHDLKHHEEKHKHDVKLDKRKEIIFESITESDVNENRYGVQTKPDPKPMLFEVYNSSMNTEEGEQYNYDSINDEVSQDS